MRRRLVYRADDVGYTQAFDMGFVKGVENGIVTSADVMLDSKHTVEALKWLRERPWITVGWHRHLWGWSVLPKEEVPSMVDENGKFLWGHDETKYAVATYEDCMKEFEAELALCKEVYGSYPVTATAATFQGERPIDKAMIEICHKYGIVLNLSNHQEKYFGPYQPELDKLNYHPLVVRKNGGDILNRKAAFDLAYFKDYDPAADMIRGEWKNSDEILFTGGHPGFLDDYIISESSCTLHRIRELQACMDERVINWIKDKKIELINTYDVLHGTATFQQHLKEVNSPLWIGNL